MKVLDKNNGKVADITISTWKRGWGSDMANDILADIYSEEESRIFGEPTAVGDLEGIIEYLTTPVDEGGAGCILAVDPDNIKDGDTVVIVDEGELYAVDFEDYYGNTYHVVKCSAVAPCDGREEYRQPALLVTNYYNGEKFEHVVFGWELPTSTEEFESMSGDMWAWELADDCAVKMVE
jgi:hypothetical protein